MDSQNETLYQETEKCGVLGKYGVKSSEYISTDINQKWPPGISFDRSHWDMQPRRNKSKKGYEFVLLASHFPKNEPTSENQL